MGPQVQRVFLRLVVPVASVVVATAVTLNVRALHNKSSLLVYLAAVVVSTRAGGWFAGLSATLISAAAIPYFILDPINKFSISDPNDVMRLMVFIFVSLMILTLHAARTRAELNLRASEQRLSLAINSAHIGVWDYNLLTRKFWWTPTLEQIYGRTSENFASTYGRFFGYIHFDDQPLFNRAITRTIDEGTEYEVDHRIVLPDDSIRWVNTRGRVFFNESRRAERIVGIATDVTARKTFDLRPHPSGGVHDNEELPKLSTVA